MKVLLSNKFFYLKGGSETSFFNTASLLSGKGNHVVYFSMSHPKNFYTPHSKYFVSRIDFENADRLAVKIKSVGRIVYSLEARHNLSKLLLIQDVDIVHLHNIHHQLSPSILHELKKNNLPIVMTLHDYKMICPVYTLLHKGKICEMCTRRAYYHCILQRCCKDSFFKSTLNTFEMYLHHRILHIYQLVDAFICPSKFLIDKLASTDFKGKLYYLPNFISLKDFSPSFTWTQNTILYFGRLSREKGLFTLLSAIKGLDVNCKILGEGPIKQDLEQKIEQESLTNVILLGYRAGDELKKHIKESMFVILPSEWYENSSFALLESFALGKPVIGSMIGGIPELIENYKTGLLFEPGNVNDLSRKIKYLVDHPGFITEMGKNARRFVEEICDPEKHYKTLMKIYQNTIGTKSDGFGYRK